MNIIAERKRGSEIVSLKIVILRRICAYFSIYIDVTSYNALNMNL